MKKPVKVTIAIIVAILVLVLIYLLVRSAQQNGQLGTGVTPSDIPDKMLENQTPEAAQATQALVNEVTGANDQNVGTINVISEEGATSTTAIQVVTVSPGTNPINIETGEVVTKTGETAVNDVAPGDQSAPQESYPIDPAVSLPQSSIKLAVTSSSFSPKEFTVNRGQVVYLVISNVNDTTYSEVFRFDDPSLSAVAVGLAKGETKAISFNAPDKAGTYTFYSAMFDHRALGAVGSMIVK